MDRWGMIKSGKVNEKAGVRKRLSPGHVLPRRQTVQCKRAATFSAHFAEGNYPQFIAPLF